MSAARGIWVVKGVLGDLGTGGPAGIGDLGKSGGL